MYSLVFSEYYSLNSTLFWRSMLLVKVGVWEEACLCMDGKASAKLTRWWG